MSDQCQHLRGLSPSQAPGAYCLDCGALVAIPIGGDYPSIEGMPRQKTYLIDGRGLNKDTLWECSRCGWRGRHPRRHASPNQGNTFGCAECCGPLKTAPGYTLVGSPVELEREQGAE